MEQIKFCKEKMWRVIRLRSLSSQSVGVCYWEPLKNFADKKKYREFSHYRFYEYNKYKRPEKQTRALKFRLCLDSSVHLVKINTWMPWICTCEILNGVTITQKWKYLLAFRCLWQNLLVYGVNYIVIISLGVIFVWKC